MSRRGVSLLVGTTLAYWVWESRAAGNIRVDLHLIYPFLFSVYVFYFWKRFRGWSWIFALALMGVNAMFFVNSYAWFGKHPG